MDRPSLFELSVLGYAFRHLGINPDFLESVELISRTYTGHGFHVSVKQNSCFSDTSELDGAYGGDIYIDVQGLKHGAGMLVTFEEGQLTDLELFTHGGEDFPENPINLGCSILGPGVKYESGILFKFLWFMKSLVVKSH